MSQPALRRYWLNRDISHLWEMNKGPLTPVDRTEEVYLAADIEQVLKDQYRVLKETYIDLRGNDVAGAMGRLDAEIQRLLARLTEGS